MSTYPDYVHQMLARARDEGQWYCRQSDAAGICFDVLALFPDCAEAKELVHQLFCDEWDDRPWQHRRRLALSYRFLSDWEGWNREYKEGREDELNGPADTAKILEEGEIELLGAYCLGDEECSDYAWLFLRTRWQKPMISVLPRFGLAKHTPTLASLRTRLNRLANSARASTTQTLNVCWSKLPGGVTTPIASREFRRAAMARVITA